MGSIEAEGAPRRAALPVKTGDTKPIGFFDYLELQRRSAVAFYEPVVLKWIYKNGRVVAVDPSAPDSADDGIRTFAARPFVYIATLYTGEDVFSGLRMAINAGEELRKRGCAVFLPQLYVFWHLLHPHAEEEWLSQCLEWLEQCDLLFLPQGEADAEVIEVAHAEQFGIPVVRSIGALDDWLAEHALPANEDDNDRGDGGAGPAGNSEAGSNGSGSGLGLSAELNEGGFNGVGGLPVHEHENLPDR